MLLILIITLALVLRLINLNQSLWLDEGINVLAAQNYSLFEMVTEYAKADFHPPGWFVLLWFWTKLFGYSEIAVRIPSVIFGVVTVYITFLIGKKILSKELGLTAAVLLTINPLHIFYSQEARMYAMAALAVSISIFLLLKMAKGERVNLVLLIVSNLFLLTSDYLAYFIFPAQIIFLLVNKKGQMLKKWLVALAVSILLGIWWLPIFLSQFNVGAAAATNLPTWKSVVGAFDFKTIPLTFVKFIIGKISLTDKFIYAAVLLPICSWFGFLLWRGIRSMDDFSRKLLLIWIIVPISLATIISFVVPIYSYFRVLFVIPPFVILIAAGILSAKTNLKHIFLITTILIEIFCSLVYLFNPSFHREDWKGLVNFFKTQSKGVILFESSGILPPFEYYAKGDLKAIGALRNFPARNEGDIINLEDLLKGDEVTYLVDYLVQISDSDRLVAKKLEDLGYKQIDIKNFTGLGFIYLYAKP